MINSAQQCAKCFYVFEGEADLLAHDCPADVDVAAGQEEREFNVQFKETENDWEIGPIEGAFLDSMVSAFVEAATAGDLLCYKARVAGAPEGGDNTYAFGILNDNQEFVPAMLLWSSAFHSIVTPRDPDITVKNNPAATETQEMDDRTD